MNSPLLTPLFGGDTALPRTVLVLLLVVSFLAVLAMMRAGWRRRAARQDDVPPPAAWRTHAGSTIDGSWDGRFLGTTAVGDWLDRIVVHGLGTPSSVRVTTGSQGVGFDRSGAASFMVPASQIVSVRLDRAACGRVHEPGGVVVLAWNLGQHVLESAVRLGQTSQHQQLLDSIEQLREAAQQVFDEGVHR